MSPVPKPAPRQKKSPKPLKRTAMPPRQTRITRTATLKASRGRRRCYQHLELPDFQEYVRAQPCIALGLVLGGKPHVCDGKIEFCHKDAKGRGHQDFGNGFPCCTLLHTACKDFSWHRGKVENFAKRLNLDVDAICRKLALAYLVDRYGRDWEMVPEAVALYNTLPPEHERAA